jgi:hypothetical protein
MGCSDWWLCGGKGEKVLKVDGYLLRTKISDGEDIIQRREVDT